MGDLKKKQTAEQVEGVGAWKSRQKVNKMFLARTIKVTIAKKTEFPNRNLEPNGYRADVRKAAKSQTAEH